MVHDGIYLVVVDGGGHFFHSGKMFWGSTTAVRNDKRNERDAAIAKAKAALSLVEVEEVVFTTVEALATAIRSGQTTSLAATVTLARRALLAQEQVNCLTEVFIDEALEVAKLRDAEVQQHRQAGTLDQLPLLHGVPMSIKDNMNIQGYDSSIGFSTLIHQPAEHDSTLVALLKQLGAVIYCKTNVPQTMLVFECANPVFGITSNPHNHDLVPGGSSGGEAALIAAGGSILGVGNDIGGSLRIPAHFCGISALKPSTSRLPYYGNRNVFYGMNAINIAVGPMANRVEDLAYFTKAVLSTQPWRIDPTVVPLPWQDVTLKSRLRIGYHVDNGFMPASPACQRAVLHVVQKLKEAGHDVFEFHPPNVGEAMRLYMAALSADGGVNIKKSLGGDPQEASVKQLVLASQMWSPVRFILELVTRVVLGARVENLLINNVRSRSVEEYWEVVHDRDLFRKQFLDAWNAMQVDGEDMDFVVCPAFGVPAVEHDKSITASAAGGYTVLYNVLDYPAGVIPVDKVRSTDVCEGSWSGKPGPLEFSEAEVHKAYNVDKMVGAPVGVQLVARHLEEEQLLHFMQHVQSLL
jgi:amidase